VQCLLIFLVLLCVFTSVAYLVFGGTKSALLVYVAVMPSSHNISASLCCCNVDRFILEVAILRYDCELALNIVVKKLFMVNTCKP
jgi:hypothetical protein